MAYYSIEVCFDWNTALESVRGYVPMSMACIAGDQEVGWEGFVVGDIATFNVFDATGDGVRRYLAAGGIQFKGDPDQEEVNPFAGEYFYTSGNTSTRGVQFGAGSYQAPIPSLNCVSQGCPLPTWPIGASGFTYAANRTIYGQYPIVHAGTFKLSVSVTVALGSNPSSVSKQFGVDPQMIVGPQIGG